MSICPCTPQVKLLWLAEVNVLHPWQRKHLSSCISLQISQVLVMQADAHAGHGRLGRCHMMSGREGT